MGAEIPGAPGFRVVFQEKFTPTLFHDLSTDCNMSWVRSDSWLTYLSLDASPPTTVTYDLGVSSTGVIRLAPYGTPPMAVVDSPRSQQPQTWLLVGTAQMLLSLVFLLGISGVVYAIVRASRRSQAHRKSRNHKELGGSSPPSSSLPRCRGLQNLRISLVYGRDVFSSSALFCYAAGLAWTCLAAKNVSAW